MSRKEQAAHEARELLLKHTDGVLCTMSMEMQGFPFGSVVPYCLDRSGAPVVYISTIAEHTHNIDANNKVTLFVFDRRGDDLQKHARLGVVGEASRCDDPDTAERYFRVFPEARAYQNMHDFLFYRIEAKRLRYIGGFGNIHWLEPQNVLPQNPFSASEEVGIVSHVNADHADVLPKYVARVLDGPVASPLCLVAVDAYGMHIKGGDRVVRVPFTRPAAGMGEVRQRFVELSKSAA